MPSSPSPIDVVIDDSLHGVIELRASGVVLLPDLRDGFRRLAELRQGRSDLRVLVFDAESVSRFGRGAVVEAARWITRNARMFDTAVTVTRSPSMKSAALALSTCAPTLRHVVVGERAQAMAMLQDGALSMTG